MVGVSINEQGRSLRPTPVVGGLRFASLTTGGGHSCGLTAAGEAYCWGSNDHGELGRGARNFQAYPVPQGVVGGVLFVALSAGLHHTCGVTAEGDAYCWGWMAAGRLGNGRVQPIRAAETAVSASPVRVVDPM